MLHKLRTRALLAAALLLTACSHSQLPGEEPGANDLAEVVFTLRMHDGAATRATRAGGESVINDIDILVFEPKNDNTGKLLEVADWYGMKPMSEEDASVTLKVRLPQNGTYNLVVLGNAGAILKQELDAGTVVPGVSTKADVIAALKVSQLRSWDIDTQAIPACGEVESVRILTTAYEKTLEVKLVRMLAKVEIDVSKLNTELFELTDVLHCNYIPGGLIVPDLTLADGMPTLLQTSATPEKTPAYTPGNDGKLTFYTFEAAVTPEPSTTGWNTGHCLVLKGRYKRATSSYYRVDFRNALGALAPALRNWNYKLTVTDVHTSGQPSLAEALNSVSNTLTMQVAEWESGDDIDFIDKNPVYEFRINNGNPFTISKGATADVSLESTSPYEWSITCDPEQLTVSPTTGTGNKTLALTAGGEAGTVKLTVNINNAYFTTNITIKE